MTPWAFDPLPQRGFSVVYADPPWTYSTWSHKGEGRAPQQHYDCMSLDAIAALPVADLAAPDAALFLWVIQPMLPQAMQLISAWGFTFKTVAYYWVKMTADGRPRKGLGYHTRQGAEQCWLATRGRGYRRMSRAEPQVVFAPLREHSRKPDEIADSVARLTGDVPRVELFARTQRPGWQVWGNQTGLFQAA